ncbi:PREDICTED: speriolin [Chinchilla lanigera]|uniref:speriolin n=1 Tax=Chinchilla lanigera TaxID=34839 RepID=UPI00038EFADD|nr:PREDICTED: speriolin [Chinchilla lanigera]
MSLHTNYEGLRHQIERLVHENEELKKLVRLIRENQELRSAIKTQAGSINISTIASGLGEVATGPAQHQGVFLSPSPAAANEPVLDEVGVVALAPLVDMLSSPHPSPTAGSLMSPLTGPFNTLLSSPAPGSQSSPFSSILSGSLGSHLAGPMTISPGGTLASSLGLPSTSPLSNHLMGPMAVSPGATLTSSLAMSKSSPLMAPVAGTVAVSLSSPLLTSTATPVGVSQNLPANPMSSLVLSEAPRLRLAEPLQGSPSGPPSSAGTGHAAISKALSSEHPQPTQGPEPLSVAFMGTPLQTSTAVGTVATPGPMMAFSYGTSDVQAQPSVPQGHKVPISMPTSSTSSPAGRVLNSAPTPAPQAAASYTPLSTSHSTSRPLPSPNSPPRNPHTPPRTSSFPASVPDTRGSRTTETNRKSIPELERKLTHRKTSKFPDSSRETKQVAWERLVGEIAFQLDRRILSSIFPERVRLYGFTVSNIPEKIIQASLNPNDHKLDEELCQTLTQRYVNIMNKLQSLGYNGRVHPALTEQLVNAYGILRERPELAASEGGSYTVDFLQRVLVETVHPNILTDALLLLSCLNQLAHDDGKPMFIW